MHSKNKTWPFRLAIITSPSFSSLTHILKLQVDHINITGKPFIHLEKSHKIQISTQNFL